MIRRWRWAVLTFLLLLAVGLRLWDLGRVPPGLSHDEVANWLIVSDILEGNHAVYFTAAYGHEPLYHYVQAVSVLVFGDNWLGLRWPSVAFALLGIATVYALTRRLFGFFVALLSVAWLSVSFWPLFYARVGLRAIMLPWTAALSAYFLCRATGVPGRRAGDEVEHMSAHSVVNASLAGLWLGLSMYTYMAARVLPLVLGGFLVYSLLISRHRCHLRWSRVLVVLLVAAVVAAPLVAWLATHPGAESRVAEIRQPLDRLLSGDPSLVWQNLVANLRSFTVVGDPWPQQNLPGRPVFAEPIGALLFYAGLAIACWRWRDLRYGLLLIWGIGALGPSVATSVAPSSIRGILGLVTAFVFPAIALAEAGKRIRRAMPSGRLPVGVFSSLVLVPCLLLTVRDYFVRWPRMADARFFYQADLTAVAHELDEQPSGRAISVAGLSVHTMDGPTLALAASTDVQDVRLCDTRETLVIPASSEDEVLVLVPRVAPVDEDLRRFLRGGEEVVGDQQGRFVKYWSSGQQALQGSLDLLETSATLPGGTSIELPASFGGHMALLGYEWLDDHRDGLELLTYWRVEDPPRGRLKVFVHLLDEDGAPADQHDGLGSPARRWASGDLVVQKHVLRAPSDLTDWTHLLQVGVYEDATKQRLSVADADRLFLSGLRAETGYRVPTDPRW